VATEFVEYRPYRQGDDPKRIDWKLLARSDRAFIRLAPDRAVLGTLIVLDASASMAFPLSSDAPSSRSKWRCAREVAVACAAIAHAGADPVGVTACSGRGIARLAPRTRRGVVAEIARTVDGVEPAGNPDLAGVFAGAPSRVLLVTDCLGALDRLFDAARAHAASGGEVLVAHIVSRKELEPPSGAVLAVDPEDEHIRRPLTDATRAAYLTAFGRWRAETARRWRDAGVGYAELVDDEPMDLAVRRLVALPV
jgi:uncharacterized protein (DUF58 family)